MRCCARALDKALHQRCVRACAECMDVPNPYPIFKAELDSNMMGNKAPIGIWSHSTATGYLTKA